ncbi:ABC transporter permease [Crossiella sp. SN42]|uniref:ABC transporter permease n=1 Tax=Crossiella sp. SN42 TaxID=2944808 RepID=UPI00207D7186|nr:ABC transporter permease [Crossiella sp. SN42]MCO1581596.1 ABC transporter permease [Crossiella sp. SN42]
MTPTRNALRTGLERARIEFRHQATSAQEVWGVLFFPVIALLVMFILRDTTVPGTTFSLGTQSLPGILAMNVMLTGFTGLAMTLTTDRADNTLLRAKATPHGMLGYLTGRILSRAGMTALGALLPLLPAPFLFPGLTLTTPTTWLALLAYLALALLAVLPLGVITGSLITNPQSLSLVTLPMMLLLAISGIFYPITALPDWLQALAQLFPLYWLGLALRSALLPESLATAELAESWRPLETILALGAWASLGLLLAPFVLRRMARRDSGTPPRRRPTIPA